MQAKMKEIREQMELEKAALAASIAQEKDQEVENAKRMKEMDKATVEKEL